MVPAKKKMSKAAFSMWVFAVYMCGLGTSLITLPNFFLRLFRAQQTSEAWIRFFGMMLFLVSFYYMGAAKHEMTTFFKWTAYARVCVLLFILVFIVFFGAPIFTVFFGIWDCAAGLWTYFSIPKLERS